MAKMIHLKIKRQDDPKSKPYWQEFKIPHRPGYNIISALMEVRKNPQTIDGKKVAAPIYESSCLEEVCGSCSMVINGRPRQACSTLIDNLDQTDPVFIEPLSKFPVVRDLIVDRSRMFQALRKIQGWVAVDVSKDTGKFGPPIPPKLADERYLFSRCMTCGCCMEACPQFHQNSDFIGPAPLGQTYYFNSHPTGAYAKEERLHAIMGKGGISDCGNAQNCVQVCPKGITLTSAIADLGRQTTTQWFKDLFRK